MEWAALIAWILTAAGGALLFVQWRKHGGSGQQEGIRTPRLASHGGTAVAGLLLWIIFVLGDIHALAWIAVALLLVATVIGISMLAISLRGTTRELRTAAPAEAMFPLPLAAGHGVLALATLILSLLTAAGVGT